MSRRPVPGIAHIAASVTDFEAVRRACAGVDIVLHLAAETEDYDDWDKVMQITMGGTLNVFRAAQEAGVKRVIFASAGSVMIGYEWYDGSPYAALAANRIPEPAGRRADAAAHRPAAARQFLQRGENCSASSSAGCSRTNTTCRCW